jgi:hypothetical protein
MAFAVQRFRFGKPAAKAGPGDVPPALSTRDVARRTAMLREARDVLPHLPAPGEALHALMTGRYDLMILLTVVLEQRPDSCTHLRIATLSLKQRNSFELLTLLDSGQVARATVLCSEFFRDHNTGIYASLQAELAKRPGGHRLAAARSHAKVVCMEMADGDRLVLEGSANLRTNSNIEQFCLLNHAALHDFHAGWLEPLVSHGEGDESGNRPTG